MLNYLRIISLSLFFVAPTLLLAQTANKENLPLISPEKLKEDFQLLKTSLEKTHAGLYPYTPKDSLDYAFNQIESSLNQPMTSINFYRKITPLLQLIGNGHTHFHAPPDFKTAINTTLLRFPFCCLFVSRYPLYFTKFIC